MKIKKICAFFVLFICMLTSLTGCGEKVEEVEEERTPIVAVILLGSHANSKCFDIQLETAIQEVYTSFGNMGIIVVDGNPALVRDDSAEILGCYNKGYQDSAKKISIDNNAFWQSNYLSVQKKKMTTALDTCKADDPEVDTLSALFTAVDSLRTIENSMGTDVEKEIIIVDTGLCTSGSLNFGRSEYQELLSYDGKIWENDAMSSKVSDFIELLEKKAEIPNLKGIKVTWYGLGQVSDPQPALSKLGIQNLQYIWGEILLKAGCLQSTEANTDERYGIFVPTSAFGSIESDQYVTPIQWNLEPEKESDESVEVELPSQKIMFCPNTDEYLRSQKEIDSVLNPYASALQDCSDKMLLLVGTTSSWRGGSQKLSEDRAEKVKSSMIKLGVPKDCIDTIGLGYDLNICQNDSPTGQFEESIAQGNRAVLILPYKSSEAQEILMNAGKDSVME